MQFNEAWRYGRQPEFAALPIVPLSHPDRPEPQLEAERVREVVSVVDVDDNVRTLLCRWLSASGFDPRAYAELAAMERADHGERPSCLIIDAQLSLFGVPEPWAISQPICMRCPLVVTAYQADVAMAVRMMKTGAVDFVEKPLREEQILQAVRAAIEIDREQRRVASHHAQLHGRFGTLSRREKQVMALVTEGKLNKQVAGDLGLSEITVKVHRGAAVRKMGARSLADLVRMADALGYDLELSRNGCSTPTRTVADAGHHSGCIPAR